ncbi:MLP-like protein 43 [Vigna umbellata]|uniref:MLP-like protein 43 n=1 Tax=Vigna umbellata TaxID=87088 RepID=UPI001F5EF386|nr:MLP-like protein 43 [Vigna umbellata]
MTLSGKVEAEVDIKASADKFFHVFRKQLQHLPNISSERIHSAVLHEGDWENDDAVKHWEFSIEGKKTSAKEKIEVVDDDNKTITFSVFDGEIGESYKSLRATLQTIDKENGGIVKWTYEYEKLSENIRGPSPESILDFAVFVTKDIDDHLGKA